MMPINLVVVRHGQSEGNVANRMSEAGDHSAYTEEFQRRHSSSFRLTRKGREQAALAGYYIQKEFLEKWGSGFDRYLTSDYNRAMETASLLRIPNAMWHTDSYLVERDWGQLDIMSDKDRHDKFGAEMARRSIQPFFWRPPNGESFHQLCLRVDRVFDTLHRECGDKNVIMVCHGEVMRAIQVRLERLSQSEFRDLVLAPKDEERIWNCQILHYTRREPGFGGRLLGSYEYVRYIRPTTEPVEVSPWKHIHRRKYSNADLMALVSETEPMLT